MPESSLDPSADGEGPRRLWQPSLRLETPADIAAIHAVTAAAFMNAPHTSHTEQFIVDALREVGALTISLVAEENGEMVGHVAVSPVSISDGSSGWYGLGPVSVRPNFQRRRIGSLLVTAALSLLREQGAVGCVVLGDPTYYGRFGFEAATTLVLPGPPAEFFQALSFGAHTPSGVVAYHDAFKVRI